MADTFYEKIYDWGTAGTVISKTPLWIRKIVLEPSAAADSAVLNFWDTSAPYAELSGTYSASTIVGTITGNTTLTMASGTLLPSSVRDGDVFKITGGSGANTNTTNVVTTPGNNTVVICANAGWTNDTSCTFNFITYPYRPAFKLLSQATTLQMVELDFGGHGFYLPNLTLETVTNTARVKIYIR